MFTFFELRSIAEGQEKKSIKLKTRRLRLLICGFCQSIAVKQTNLFFFYSLEPARPANQLNCDRRWTKYYTKYLLLRLWRVGLDLIINDVFMRLTCGPLHRLSSWFRSKVLLGKNSEQLSVETLPNVPGFPDGPLWIPRIQWHQTLNSYNHTRSVYSAPKPLVVITLSQCHKQF